MDDLINDNPTNKGKEMKEMTDLLNFLITFLVKTKELRYVLS
jgi:hypothetical protein